MGEQSPPLPAPRAAAARHTAHTLHGSMHCYAARPELCPAAAPGDRRIPRQPSGGGCAPPSPLSQPGGAVEESGAVSQRPPAPRAVLHVEAQQVVQHRLPEGGNGEELRRPRCCCAGGPQPPPPPSPCRPYPDPLPSAPARSPRPSLHGLPPHSRSASPRALTRCPRRTRRWRPGRPPRCVCCACGRHRAALSGAHSRAAAPSPPIPAAPALTGHPRTHRRAGGGASGAPSRRARS